MYRAFWVDIDGIIRSSDFATELEAQHFLASKLKPIGVQPDACGYEWQMSWRR